MSANVLPYLSTQRASDLWANVSANLDRYASGTFDDILASPGVQLQLQVPCDLGHLQDLSSSASDLDNAKVVWRALKTLTPNLARENRIWTCLCHGEALAYSRARWFADKADETLKEAVQTHMFARTLTQCRDDNALARLWWTAYIADRTASGNFDDVLALLLKTADIRSNFVERTWMTTRPSIARGIVRAMVGDSWVTSSEKSFRETMKALNVRGAGIAFEVLSERQADDIIGDAVAHAKASVGA